MTLSNRLPLFLTAIALFAMLAGVGASVSRGGAVVDFEAIEGPLLNPRGETPEGAGAVHLDSTIVHSGNQSVRVDYNLSRGSGSIDLTPFPADRDQLPEGPWGLEFWYRAPDSQSLRVLVRLREESRELWDAEVSLTSPKDRMDEWHLVRIPFGWFRLITWERRDGRLRLDELESIGVMIRSTSQEVETGSLWIDSLSIVDATHSIPVGEVDERGFLALDLDGAFDSDAIAWRQNPTDGDFHTGEWEPRTLPAEHFPDEVISDLAGIPFRTPPLADGLNNHFRSNGQYITGFEPGHYTTAYVLASGKFGDQFGDVTLHYEDGTSEKVGLRVSDWSMSPRFEESVGLLLPYAYFRQQIDRHREPRLFVQSLRVDPERELVGIRLATNDFQKVFGITLATQAESPEVGEFSSMPLARLDPRLEMAERDTIDFTQPVRPVGVLGGYVVRRGGSYGLDIPTFNGFMTFTADARHLPQGLLEWHNFQNRNFRLGGVEVASERAGSGDVEFLDEVTLRYFTDTIQGDSVLPFSMHVSRAWPAALYTIAHDAFEWIDSPEQTRLQATLPAQDGFQTIELSGGVEVPIPSEPWLLLWHLVGEEVESTGRQRDFATPILVVLERRPVRIVASEAGPPFPARLGFQFEGHAGKVAAMPLQGIRRVPAGETRRWAEGGIDEDVLAEARTWSRRLQRFPMALQQESRIDQSSGMVEIEDRFDWSEMESEWDVEAEFFTPLSPTVLLASDNGYDAVLPTDLVRSDVSAFYGPLAGRQADSIKYQIPLADHVTHMPTLTRAIGHPLLEEAAVRLASLLDEKIPDNLSEYTSISDISQDVAQLRLLGPARLLIGADERVHDYARAVMENAFQEYNLKLEKEPLTGQYYLMDDRFWAKDALYDKEWSIGFILQGLWTHAYYHDDRGFIADHWGDIRGLYRYYQLHFDWATNSTFTMTTGVGANSDGIRIAYEGMLAMTRLAEMVEDEETRRDGLVRTARQRLSLYASWFAPQWAADHDYVMSRYRHVAPEEAELRFSPDHLWSEYFTTNTAFPEDFFQTNHAFFVFNLAHLMFLHDVGIAESRLRAWIFETIPELHPDWCDGNKRVGERGRYYGDAHAMSLLIARAMLFEGTLEDALECLRLATEDTAVMNEWYRPTGLIPMMLAATITGGAPRTLIPVESFAIIENTYDVETGEQVVVLDALGDASDFLRVRVIESAPRGVTINGEEMEFAHDDQLRYTTIPLVAAEGQRLTIMIRHEPRL